MKSPFLTKLSRGTQTVSQWIHVARAAAALPQTTTRQLFRVYNGRIRVRLLLGEVTTVIASSDPVLSIVAKRLDNGGAAVGTAYTIASSGLALTSDEVGSLYTVEGDGTDLISPQLAGAGYFAAQSWIMPQGEIYANTTASKSGAMKWDLWYEPLDPGAYAVAVDVATAAI